MQNLHGQCLAGQRSWKSRVCNWELGPYMNEHHPCSLSSVLPTSQYSTLTLQRVIQFAQSPLVSVGFSQPWDTHNRIPRMTSDYRLGHLGPVSLTHKTNPWTSRGFHVFLDGYVSRSIQIWLEASQVWEPISVMCVLREFLFSRP